MKNYGGLGSQNTEHQDYLIKGGQKNRPKALNGHNSISGRLSASFSHSEDLSDSPFANAMDELDPDILSAMENLSLTEEDMTSAAIESQNAQKGKEFKGRFQQSLKIL